MRKVFRGDLNRFKRLCELYKNQNRNFEIKQSGSVAIIILDNREMFFKEKNENKQIPILCKSVINDVRKWQTKNETIKLESKKVVFHNKNNIKNNIGNIVVGYDIVSCYWEIAFRDNLISKKTYELGVENKSARTLAIGNLNKRTFKTTYKGSKEIKEIINSKYSSAYNYIIKEVQIMYNELKEIFKDEILSWRTDCIYLSNSTNEKQIEKYFETKSLKIKKSYVKIIECKKHKAIVQNIEKDKTIVWNV